MTDTTGNAQYWSYPAGHTRQEYLEEVARVFGYLESTATGGSTSTVVDTRLSRYANDYFIGAQVYIRQADGAAPQNESAWVTDFASSTGTLTVSPAFSAAVASGDRYEVYRLVSRDDIIRALNRVCYGGRAIQTLTPSATTLDYSLNNIAGLYSPGQVLDVWVRPLNDDTAVPQRVSGWRIQNDAGVMTLRLLYTLNPRDALWIEFLTAEDNLPFDDSRVDLPMALVRARACRYLIQNILMTQDAGGLDRWGQLLRYWEDETARQEKRWQRPVRHVRRYGFPPKAATTPVSAAEGALGLLPNPGGDFSSYP